MRTLAEKVAQFPFSTWSCMIRQRKPLQPPEEPHVEDVKLVICGLCGSSSLATAEKSWQHIHGIVQRLELQIGIRLNSGEPDVLFEGDHAWSGYIDSSLDLDRWIHLGLIGWQGIGPTWMSPLLTAYNPQPLKSSRQWSPTWHNKLWTRNCVHRGHKKAWSHRFDHVLTLMSALNQSDVSPSPH